jgi:hypothetical protein
MVLAQFIQAFVLARHGVCARDMPFGAALSENQGRHKSIASIILLFIV